MRSSPVRTEPQTKARPLTSPERPKSTACHSRAASDARNLNRTSKALSSHKETPQERHSRRSLHSRSQSRHSRTQPKKQRGHSRSQSTAFPHFDISTPELQPLSIGNAITTAADGVSMLPESSTRLRFITRDMSGNLTYGVDEEPEIEELSSSSIGFRTSNGRVNSMEAHRQSRLASLHESSRPQLPHKLSKRNTAVPFPSSSPTAVRPAGLGLFPVDARAEPCAASERDRERTPLSTLQRENGDGDELQVSKGRQTWGSWRKTMISMGSR